MYRRLGVGLVAATMLAGIVLPAAAAEPATMLSPADGDVISGNVTLRVKVDTYPVSEVSLRLSKDGASQATGTASIPLPCVQDCEGTSSSIWGNRTFDPTAGAPFSAGGVCNGTWTIQGRLDKGQWTNLAKVVLSAPPLAPANVRVAQVDGTAELTWSTSKTPDVIGYRVERSSSGTGWVAIGHPGTADTRFRDDAVSEGTYRYRVIALRPDGLINGNPAAPCADEGSDYEATSSEASLRYEEPVQEPSPQPTPTPTDPNGNPTSSPTGDPNGDPSEGPSEGSDGSGTDGSTGGSDGTDPSDPQASPSDSGTDGTTTTGDSTGSYRPGRSRTVAAPPAARRQTDTRITAPGLQPGAEPPPETFYGEEGGVGELDYSGADAIVGQEIIGYDEDGQPIYRLVPGALQETGIAILDGGKMRAIAMGLLLVALALHARRWMLAG